MAFLARTFSAGRAGALVVLFCLLLPTGAHALTDAEKAGARAAAEQGGLAYQDGRFAEAVDYFTRAEEIVHATPHLLYIARANAKLGRLIAAREAYLKIVQEEVSPKGPRIFVETKAQAEAELAELEPRIPQVTVVLEGASADEVEVLRDGEVLPSVLIGIAQPMDPGEHTFEAKGKHRATVTQKVMIREGAGETVVLKVGGKTAENAVAGGGEAVESDRKGKPGLVIAGYSALGLGLVGGVLGTVFLVESNNSYRAADAIYGMCTPTSAGAACSSDQLSEINSLDDQGQTQTIIGATALAVGGAAVVTGVVLLVMGGKAKKEAASAAHVEPMVGLGTLGLRGSF